MSLLLSSNLINLNSEAGEQLLMESKARKNYLQLSINFTPQQNGAYCGVASSVIVLNALPVPAPDAPEYGAHCFFTQNNFLNNNTESIVAADLVSRQGITLDELSALLRTHEAKALVYHTNETSLFDFRALAIKNLSEPGKFIVVNYSRKILQQGVLGHFSPLGAYHEETDRFLILDVSPYLHPPVWVKTDELWRAMDTVDEVANKKRGFVMVSTEY